MKLLPAPLLAAAVAWSAAAIAIDCPASPWIARLLAASFVLAALGCLLVLRPLRRGVLALAVLFAVVVGWWLSLEPSNERDWLPDVARPPTVAFDGDRVTIRNVRDFRYRSETEYDERWEERSYDLSHLRGFDMFLSYWGSSHIAHTIASWEFEDGEHLAISIETRKERGESYSSVLGFFRQYELYYVIADERDLVGLRTDHRGEDVYLYRMRMPAARARKLLLDYLEEVDRLAREPRWYNALTQNCTTTIRLHMRNIGVRNPLRWQLLANGHLDELGYQQGSIDTSLPFEELRRRSYITPVARALEPGEDYSAGIRRGLPDPRAASARQPPPRRRPRSFAASNAQRDEEEPEAIVDR